MSTGSPPVTEASESETGAPPRASVSNSGERSAAAASSPMKPLAGPPPSGDSTALSAPVVCPALAASACLAGSGLPRRKEGMRGPFKPREPPGLEPSLPIKLREADRAACV
jgi:hypothetical protein